MVVLKIVLIPLLQVILSPDADPPVVRIMDYKYDMLYANLREKVFVYCYSYIYGKFLLPV